jgi:hypothetical protein
MENRIANYLGGSLLRGGLSCSFSAYVLRGVLITRGWECEWVESMERVVVGGFVDDLNDQKGLDQHRPPIMAACSFCGWGCGYRASIGGLRG